MTGKLIVFETGLFFDPCACFADLAAIVGGKRSGNPLLYVVGDFVSQMYIYIFFF